MKTKWIILAVIIGTAFNAVPVCSTRGNVLITEIYYDTYLKGDTDGEFIRIHNPTEGYIDIGGWQLTDREGVITFPSWAGIDAGDSLYLAYNATAFYDEMLQDADFEYGVDSDPTPNMAGMDLWLKLRNGGDEVILKDDGGEIVDVAIYGDSNYTDSGWNGSPIKRVKDERGWTWGVILEREINETTGQYEDTNTFADWDGPRVYIVGQSHFPYETFCFNGNLTLFTSPDSSFEEIANAVDNAEKSIYLNVYQFHHLYLMDHLIEAIKRGVEVKIMLEGDPVNGIGDEERYIAREIVNASGEVRFMIDDEARGIHDRYVFNHAKYAVIDNETTIVMSENWKNTGVPVNNTFGNRGWGIIVNNPAVSNYFSRVFFEDWKPASRDSFPFTPDDPIYGNKYGAPPHDFAPDRTIPIGNYSHPFPSKIISAKFNISPVLAPDTSLMQTKSVIGMICGAKKSVYVEQCYIDKDWGRYANPGRPNPFLEAVIDAARRGCEVKVLLDSRYERVRNVETIEYLRDIAKEEDLELEARLIDNDAIGLNKTHNKGVIVDRSKVLISSINWGENSARNNREAGLVIENEDVAKFYTDVFLYDWHNGSYPLTAIFDTGSGTYPSISGTHKGTITPNQTITVHKLYTYPCSGTGGHTEYARIWNSTLAVNATWNGYKGDWHNITFDEPFTLFAEETYYYEIITGSYPQIHHTDEWEAEGGMGIINCTSFVDANGKVYNNWIPAIMLWSG